MIASNINCWADVANDFHPSKARLWQVCDTENIILGQLWAVLRASAAQSWDKTMYALVHSPGVGALLV